MPLSFKVTLVSSSCLLTDKKSSLCRQILLCAQFVQEVSFGLLIIIFDPAFLVVLTITAFILQYIRLTLDTEYIRFPAFH